MALRSVFRFACTVLVVPFGATAQHSFDDAREYSGLDIGLVEVHCDFDDAGMTRRRGVLLDTRSETAKFEIVLTAAHGFPAEAAELLRACSLKVDDESSFTVAREWRAQSIGRGYRDDWAVLLIDGRLPGDVARLPLAPIERQELRAQLLAEASVRLPLRFAPTERPCELMQSTLTPDEVESGVLAHNCVSWPGHSGSPILVDLDGVPHVLGLHIGTRWVFETNRGVRIGRYVDDRIASAVDAAIEAGRALDAAHPRRGFIRRLFGG